MKFVCLLSLTYDDAHETVDDLVNIMIVIKSADTKEVNVKQIKIQDSWTEIEEQIFPNNHCNIVDRTQYLFYFDSSKLEGDEILVIDITLYALELGTITHFIPCNTPMNTLQSI